MGLCCILCWCFSLALRTSFCRLQGRMGWDPDFMGEPGQSLTFPGGSLSRSQGPLGAGKHLGLKRGGLTKSRPSLPKAAAAAAAAAAAVSGGSEPAVMPNQCHRCGQAPCVMHLSTGKTLNAAPALLPPPTLGRSSSEIPPDDTPSRCSASHLELASL